jgi:hypothetical protein
LREHGFSGAETETLSPAQLTWQLKQVKRRAADRNKRLLVMLAAAHAGGPAPQKVFRMLDQEARALQPVSEPEAEPECETPLSTADFERMMKEENGG